MVLPKQLTTVTALSKTIALIIFIVFPFLGFWLGTKYQKQKDSITSYTKSGNTIEQAQQDIPKVVVPSPKPNPVDIPTGWKTYQNDSCHFSLSYPPTWIVKNKCIDPTSPIDCIQTKDYNGTPGVTVNTIPQGHLIELGCSSYYSGDTQYLMNSCLSERIQAAQKNESVSGVCKVVNFGGYSFVTEHDAYEMINNQILYSFKIEKTIETNKQYGSTVDEQILSTLKIYPTQDVLTSKNGYSVAKPSGWFLISDLENNSEYMLRNCSPEGHCLENVVVIRFTSTLSNNPKNLPIEEWVKEQKFAYRNYGEALKVNATRISINSIQAIKVSDETNSQSWVYIPISDKVLTVSYLVQNGQKSYLDQHTNDLDKILSTFQITK